MFYVIIVTITINIQTRNYTQDLVFMFDSHKLLVADNWFKKV